MLGRLARELPAEDDYFFEPKWDGFRSLAFRAPDSLTLRSRNDRALERDFPELAAALTSLSSRPAD